MSRVRSKILPSATPAMLELRQNLLDALPRSSQVLDCFCGSGEMFRGVWKNASGYAGIDEAFDWPTTFPRWVGDNQRVLRAINLRSFNIFDLDADGSPWAAAIIIATRRRWAKGELGGIAISDGSRGGSREGQLSQLSYDVAQLLGVQDLAPGRSQFEQLIRLHDKCMHAWAKLAGVKVIDRWRAHSSSTLYGAAVFEGL